MKYWIPVSFLYFPAVWLLVFVPSADAINSARPLERPTGLIIPDALRLLAEQVQRIKDPAAPKHAPVRVEGVDPARQLEKEAAAVVPTTLPPAEKIENKEAAKDAQTAAELTGVKPNEHGDYATAFVAFSINATVVLICALIFSALRLKFPRIYSGNVENGDIPEAMRPQETFFGWVNASLGTTTEMAADLVGLDGALLLEFCNVNCKIMALIAVPMVTVMCPLHLFYGGNDHGVDTLSSIGMANVQLHHPWLYYLHALIINLVTVLIIRVIYEAMQKFLPLRYGWLKSLTAPRCVTVLVEGIPPEWRSDARLREYFAMMFDKDTIKECRMVKDHKELKKLFDEKMMYQESLAEAEEDWESKDFDEDQRPMMSETMCGKKETDAMKFYEDKIATLTPQVTKARIEAIKEAETVGGINTATGFVTFERRRNAAVCKTLVFSPKRSDWLVSTPPPTTDILWQDLKQDDNMKRIYSVIAYVCVVGLYVIFLPLVMTGTLLTSLVHMGYFQPLWASFAPGLSLMLFLGFLPTLLLLVFRSFFTLKADSFAQHKLQVWYFFFLVFFVILVTTIGQSLVQTFTKVVRRPEEAIYLMAEHMPTATHFYMDFLMLQWGEQAVNFMRHVPLIKFLLFKHFFGHDEQLAKELCEPEDQDYYGIGSRSARFTVNMLIGIVFCTLCPMISVLCLILFGLCRLFYGYLIVFAETRKPDLGGVFYFTKLQHLILGTGLYNLLMIGVLCFRAKTKAPMFLSLPALLYTIHSYRDFSRSFVWTELPFAEASFHLDTKVEESESKYIQPEFLDEPEVELEFGKSDSTMAAEEPRKTAHMRRSTVGGTMNEKQVHLAKAHFLGQDGKATFAGGKGSHD